MYDTFVDMLDCYWGISLVKQSRFEQATSNLSASGSHASARLFLCFQQGESNHNKASRLFFYVLKKWSIQLHDRNVHASNLDRIIRSYETTGTGYHVHQNYSLVLTYPVGIT